MLTDPSTNIIYIPGPGVILALSGTYSDITDRTSWHVNVAINSYLASIALQKEANAILVIAQT